MENFPGFPEGVLGPDLMDRMREQAEKFGAMIEYDDVTSVDFSNTTPGAIKTLHTDGGNEYQARTVIVATGSEPRKLGVPGEKEFSGRGVSYCATCDGFFFRDKPIVVVGGGDSAMEEADFLSRFGSSVTIVHRRDEFRASRIMIERVQQNSKIELAMNSVVDEIHGDDENGATEVVLRDVVSGEKRTIPANGVFVAIGHTPQTAFLNGALDLAADGTVIVDGGSTRTSVPGVFAAGDNADSVYRQAISAAGMGCRAALDAQAYLVEAE